MSTTKDIEDALLALLGNSGLFQQTGSAIEGNVPDARKYPCAFVFFNGDRDETTGSRPALDMEFGVLVFNRNLRSSGDAARGTYELLDKTRDALNGKRGGLADIEPFRVTSRKLYQFEGGEAVYEMTIAVAQKLPVITME